MSILADTQAPFTVIVKRTTGAAIVRDLARHLPGVEFLILNGWPLPDGGESRITFTVAACDATAAGDALRRWFAEGDDHAQDQPYPTGSLLWFHCPEAVR